MLRACLLAALLLASTARPGFADKDPRACQAMIAQSRLHAAALPADDLSRRFAERELDSAALELAAGDLDDCEMMAKRAKRTIQTRPYALRPGEALNGYGPDRPALVGSASTATP